VTIVVNRVARSLSRDRRIPRALVVACALVATVCTAYPAHAQRAVQVSPDGQNLLISKPLNGQQWSIVVNFDAQTIAGNVFNSDGSDPQFVYCAIVDPFIAGPTAFSDIATVILDCKGGDGCDAFPCSPAQWTDLGEVSVTSSFFVPPNATLGCTQSTAPQCAGTCSAGARCAPVEIGCVCISQPDPTPTPVATPQRTSTPVPQPTFTFSPGGGDPCCRHCTTGIPCGDSCISASKTCHTVGGCACF
jgi:hypothetical protein